MPKKAISIRLDVDLLKQLDHDAKAMGITRTDLIEQRCGDSPQMESRAIAFRGSFGEMKQLPWWAVMPLCPDTDIVELSIRHIWPIDSIARPDTKARIEWEKANPIVLPDGKVIPHREPSSGEEGGAR